MIGWFISPICSDRGPSVLGSASREQQGGTVLSEGNMGGACTTANEQACGQGIRAGLYKETADVIRVGLARQSMNRPVVRALGRGLHDSQSTGLWVGALGRVSEDFV